jgi:hypothetical protein
MDSLALARMTHPNSVVAGVASAAGDRLLEAPAGGVLLEGIAAGTKRFLKDDLW